MARRTATRSRTSTTCWPTFTSTSPNYDKSRGYELTGLVWFQGWNDMVDGE